ncbi:MAG: Glutamine transport ATP-binding protein GlnQ [Chlamydiae bacterium]|nr:Glutamine transport ATP-binding protein GlnQ [Chlamydiota bacterium]
MFHCHNLCKKYGSKAILKSVNFSMKKGEIAVLLGHSGVGKSTLLRVLNNLESYDEGDITINGTPVDFNDIGMVFQGYHLFDHLSAVQNITVPLKVSAMKSDEEAKQIAFDLLYRFDLTEYAKSFPAELSGGQKQRLAISRAMAMGPSVLCMDEPTSALDPRSTIQAIEQIKKLSHQGYSVLITTHDIAMIQYMDCTVHLMEDGQIVESATSKNLENSPRIQSYLLGETPYED